MWVRGRLCRDAMTVRRIRFDALCAAAIAATYPTSPCWVTSRPASSSFTETRRPMVAFRAKAIAAVPTAPPGER